MREVFLSEELEAQVESMRGETPFETWLALAIQEKAFWGTRWSMLAADMAEEEILIAVVECTDEHRASILLWRTSSTLGVNMMPVIVTSREAVAEWEERIALELNWMDGPPIAWRRFSGGEFVSWLRAPAVEQA